MTSNELADASATCIIDTERDMSSTSKYKSTEDTDMEQDKGKLSMALVLTVFACVIGSSFQFGYHTGVLNTPGELLQAEIQNRFLPLNPGNGSECSSTNNSNCNDKPEISDRTSFIWAVIVAIFGGGGLVGGVTGGFFATKLGRKKMMLLNNIILIMAVACMMSSKFVRSFELIIVGRFVHGINCGFSTVVAPLYLNEISPVNLRGGVGTMHQLAITCAILLSQAFGLKEVLGTRDHYYLIFGIPLVAGFLQAVILPFCPESPSWLYINQRKPEESRKALEFFGKSTFNVKRQFMLYEAEVTDQLNRRNKVSCCDFLTKSYLLRPLLIAVVMQLSQQCSGIIAILNYSTSILTKTGLKLEEAQYGTIGSTGVIVLMTVVSVLFMDRVGRRPLHLIGLSGCLVSMIIFTITLFTLDSAAWVKYLSIVALVLFIIAFASGPGSIPWFITAELFDQESRPYAISVATLFNWLGNSLSGLLFPIMQAKMGYYCFIPFIVLLVLFVVFTIFQVPETKNKTTEEIVAIYRSKKGRAKSEKLDSQLTDLSN